MGWARDMTQQQRLNELLALVSERGNVTIAEITETLGISAATARRSLTTLAAQRLVTRTHGGAAALGTGYELPLHYKIARQAEAKVAIATVAAGFITPGDAVGLNGGTTTSEVARAIGRSETLERAGGDVGVTIVTNALNIAYELSVRNHVKIVVTGGVARRQSYELVGPLVSSTLANFALDIAILGVDGISPEMGATTFDEGEADVSRQFVRVADRVILVADSTKMLKSKFARICGLDQVDTLVTDAPLPAELQAAADAAQVEVVTAE
jgi:DeoR family transcriptional regulator, aga operon transcriptional repressor